MLVHLETDPVWQKIVANHCENYGLPYNPQFGVENIFEKLNDSNLELIIIEPKVVAYSIPAFMELLGARGRERVPVAMLTEEPSRQSMERSLEYGAFGYFGKREYNKIEFDMWLKQLIRPYIS